jgi:HAD superfamily hydrolase (TIGR01509 family)
VSADLIIFDCDGVLVDSEPISNRVLATMLGEQGLELDVPETRRRFQGLLLGDIQALAERQIGRALPADWMEEYTERRTEAFRVGLKPVPGARHMLELLTAAGIPICVASQGSLAKTEGSLTMTGLADLLPAPVRFSAHLVPRGKPHPDLFLHAAATMGHAPADCVVVEDTPSGVTAAVRAGMPVYGYSADSDEQALRAAGALTAETLEEITRLLLGDAESPLAVGGVDS